MEIKYWAVLICVVSFFSVNAQENKLSNAELVKFKASLAKNIKVNSLSADFVQYKKVGYVKKDMISSGKFYVKHPDKLAWIYTSPVSYSMIFKDKKLLMNDQGKSKTKDLSRSKQFGKISEAIQANVGGTSYQGNEFTSNYFQSPKYFILKLDPVGKDLKKAMKQIVLYFDKKNYQIEEVKLIEPTDTYTRFVLSNHKINTSFSDSVFDL